MDLFARAAEQSVSIQADTRAALIEPGLAMTMAEMRRLFAVELKTEAASQPLVISIENVVNLADYQAVTQLVAGIQTLEQVRPIAVEGESCGWRCLVWMTPTV